MSRSCEYGECERKHYSGGLCQAHYNQRRTGRELAPIRKRDGGHTQQDGYVRVAGTYAHRLVMQGVLGRRLLPQESVHHKNGDRADNDPANLELWYSGQPAGQRIPDLIAYIARYHSEAMWKALED